MVGRQVRRGPILVLRTGGETISQAEADTALDAVRGADQKFPLGLKVPNAATRAAMAESKAIIADRRACARGTPEA